MTLQDIVSALLADETVQARAQTDPVMHAVCQTLRHALLKIQAEATADEDCPG
jgi:hypothetical protein